MMIQPQQAGFRKAAILVAALDRAAADEVLDRMGPDQCNASARPSSNLDQSIRKNNATSSTSSSAWDRWFRGNPRASSWTGTSPGDWPMGRTARPRRRAPGGGEPARPFRFLRQAQCDQIARLLVGERPQTIALVLSHLAEEQAGRVLVLLAPAMQVEVVRRLVDLEETDPEVLREVERALQSRLAQRVPMQRRRVAGASAVSGILRASEQSVGRRILDNLATHDEGLAEQFASEAPYGRGLSRFFRATDSTPPIRVFAAKMGLSPLRPPLRPATP